MIRHSHLPNRLVAVVFAMFVVLTTLTSEASAQETRGKTISILGLSGEGATAQYYSSGSDSVSAVRDRFFHGVQLGVEEARRTGSLFGWNVVLSKRPFASVLRSSHELEATILVISDLSTIPGNELTALKRVLVVGASDGGATCHSTVFKIRSEPSAWDSTAEKFGAAQLNARYRERFNEGMDSRAWAGWMAVKVATEAAFRLGTSNVAKLRRYLLSDSTRFDGHRGIAFRFFPSTMLLMDSENPPVQAPCT